MASVPVTLASAIAPAAPTQPTESKENSLHRYVTYDPQATISRSGKWSNFWTVAKVVNLIASLAIIALGFSLSSSASLPVFAFGLLSASLACVLGPQIQRHIDRTMKGHFKAVEMATLVLEKMNEIKDEDIPAKLKDMGLERGAVPLAAPEQLKTIIARYEAYGSMITKKQDFLRRNEIYDKPLTLTHVEDEQTDYANIVKGRNDNHLLRQEIAHYKLEMAYILYVLTNPQDVSGKSSFIKVFPPSPTILHAMFTKVFGDKIFEVFAFRKDLRLSLDEILAKTPHQLYTEILNATRSS